MSEPSDGFVLQGNLIPRGLCQGSYCSLLGLSACLEFQPFTLCSIHQRGFGVRDSPSSHPHLIPGQFGSRKAPGSPHCVQDEFLVVQYSFYCPRSLQAQRLPTSVASPAVTAPPQHGWSSVAVINATFLPNVPWSNRFLKLHKHNLCTMINYLTENDALS